MRRSARLAAGTALVLGFAALALGSGFDRMSAWRAEAAGWTPAPLRAQAARTLADEALARKDMAAAQREARRAVLRDPIDTQSLGMLGQVALVGGQAEPARAAFTLSGQLGWREPKTQAYWMASALQAGEPDAAAQRLDAILRQQPMHPQRAGLLALFEGSEAGRFRLAERLRMRPAWAVPYFHVLADLPPATLAARGEVAVDIAATYGQRDCAMVSPLVGQGVFTGDPAMAYRVWWTHCVAPGDNGLLADGGFESTRLTQPPTPFDWQFSSDGTLSLTLGAAQGFSGQALTAASDASGDRVLASRAVRFPAGRYTASWRALDEAGKASQAVSVAVSCSPAERKPLTPLLRDAATGRFTAPLDIAATCPTQWLSLGLAAKSGSVTVDDIAITRQ